MNSSPSPCPETLILASSSPRRREILASLSLPFVILAPDTDERVFDTLAPADRTVALATAKAKAGAALAASQVLAASDTAGGALRLVLGADTLVALPHDAAAGRTAAAQAASRIDGAAQNRAAAHYARRRPERDAQLWTVLGKPQNRGEAGAMTALLAGKTHYVFTGIALLDRFSGQIWTALSTSRVSFSSMTEAEIERYLDSREWEGAAGGYKLQGPASFHIDRVEGSPSGVMGLPIREFYGILVASGAYTP